MASIDLVPRPVGVLWIDEAELEQIHQLARLQEIKHKLLRKYKQKVKVLQKKGQLVEPEDTEGHSCPICLEKFDLNSKSQGAIGVISECKHFFHFGCIWKWASEKKSCPLCRIEIKMKCKHAAAKSLLVYPYCQALIDIIEYSDASDNIQETSLEKEETTPKRKAFKRTMKKFMDNLNSLLSPQISHQHVRSVAMATPGNVRPATSEIYFSYMYCL